MTSSTPPPRLPATHNSTALVVGPIVSLNPAPVSRISISNTELLRSATILRGRIAAESTPLLSSVVQVDADEEDIDSEVSSQEIIGDDDKEEVDYVITSNLTVGSATSAFQTIGLAVLVVCVFLLTGTLFFGLVENWSILDALYFSTSTVTTCGIGDLVPQHTASKIFMIFYVVMAVLLIGSALGLLAQAALQRHERLREQVLQRLGRTDMTSEEEQPASPSGSRVCLWIAAVMAKWDAINPIAQRSIVALIALFLILVSTAIFFTQSEGWTILDSVYYAVLVSSTVGLGDVVAESDSAKIFSIFLMLCGSAIVATSLTGIAEVFIRHSQHKLAEKILLAQVRPESLPAMDLDNSGSVSQQEFLEFMLVHMGLVSPEDIAAINKRFEELDRNHSGTLDLDDLCTDHSHHQLHDQQNNNNLQGE